MGSTIGRVGGCRGWVAALTVMALPAYANESTGTARGQEDTAPCASPAPGELTSFIGLGESKAVFDLDGGRSGRRVFRLRTHEETGVRIFTTGSAAVYGSVFSENNDRFVAWDAPVGRRNLRIDARLPAGAWCVRAETEGGGVYGLHVVSVDRAFDGDGNVALGADEIHVGSAPVSIEGAMEGPDDVDYFRLGFDAPGWVTVRGYGETRVHGWIVAYDEDARTAGASGWDVVTADRDEPGRGTLVAGAAVAPGATYYLVVSADPVERGDYRLQAHLDPGPASGDAMETAVPAAVGGILERRIRSADAVEYFRIEPDRDTDLRIFSTGDIDLRATVLDAEGREVAGDDDGGDGGNFSVHARLAGPHYVRVEGVGGMRGDYGFVVTREPIVPDEGAAIENARPIGVDEELQAWFRGADDREDVYRIELAERTDLRVGTTGRLNTWGRLVTTAQTLVAVDHDSGEGGNFLLRPLLDPGIYYLFVRPTWLAVGGGPYRLFVRGDGSRDGRDDDDTIHRARELEIGSALTARIDSHADSDYVRFRLEEPRGVRVFTEGRTDTVGQLLGLTAHALWSERWSLELESSGTFPAWDDVAIVASDDDSGARDNFLFERQLPAGEYAVRVRGGGSTGDYELVLEPFKDDHGDWRREATPVAFGSPVPGVIDSATDVDYFRIPVKALGEDARIVVFSTGDLDTVGTLEAGSGELLATDDDGGSDRNFLLVHDDDAVGSIFVRVEGHEDATGAYALVLAVASDGG